MTRETMAELLDQVKRQAQHASLTNSMKGGVRPMVDMYNRCLEALKAAGDNEVGEFFLPLAAETATIEEVGTCAALLSRYLRPVRKSSLGSFDEE